MPLSSIILIAIAIGVIGIADFYVAFGQKESASKTLGGEGRLSEYLVAAKATRLGLSDLRQAIDATFGQIVNVQRISSVGNLEKNLTKAGFPFRPAEWILIEAGGSVVLAFLLYWRFSFNPIAFAVGLVIGLILGHFILSFSKGRRWRKFEKQLADAVVALGSAMKAGFSLNQALEATVRDLEAPCGTEFRRVVHEISLGIPIDDAMAHLVERTDSDDLALLAKTISVSRKRGGSMAEVTQKVALVIREKIQIRAEVRILTAQVKFSGYILALLPFFLAGFLALTQPGYFSPMLSETLGKILLGVAALSIVIGMLIIRKIADIEY